MQFTRRALLGNGALGIAALGSGVAPGFSGAAVVPSYRIIYNWDGAPAGFSEYPQSMEQFLEKTYAPMRDTQVGAHFWCVFEDEPRWAKVKGSSSNRVYNSVNDMRLNENVRAMLERGENPYHALVQRGHELGLAVYASVRMNDNHLNGLQVEDIPKSDLPGVTTLRKEHPEWCLGAKQAPKWFAASWNFAIPEVREYRLRNISEVCELADWDGVELDWQRHAFHLPADDSYRLRYTLTDLQRAARTMTNNIARRRGRPFFVAVRVATTMEACRRIGYDLRTWAAERLCDVMISGGGAGTDPGIEVEAFNELLKGTGIRFYPAFDGGLWGEHKGLVPEREWENAWVRATALGYWNRGADGMYVFNWQGNQRTRRALMTTIGDSTTLRRTDKVYEAVYRHVGVFPPDCIDSWAGADLNDRLYGETPVTLYRTLTSEGPQFHIFVHDEVQGEARAGALESVEMHLELEHFSPRDRIAVALDSVKLPAPAVRSASRETRDDPSDVEESSWLVWSLTPQQTDRGPHVVQLRLLERDPRVKPPLVVQHVEIHVRFRKKERT